MTSKFLIDPEILPVLDLMPTLTLTMEVVPLLRAAMKEERANAVPLPGNDSVSVETITVPGPDSAPPVRMLAYRPKDSGDILPALFHIHGGGYIVGTFEMVEAELRDIAASLRCAVFTVDYRLAPETPFPGAVEDCYAALHWVAKHAAKLRIDDTRIGIKGESAGGGLAAALALLARDRGEITVAFQHLIYPMLDDRTCVSKEPHPFTGEFIWTLENNRFGWSCLLGTAPGADVSPYAAAARAPDLSGLPPAFIAVGVLDLFLEENMEYARRLSRAGVPVELHVYPGAVHGFHMMPTARLTISAERDSRDALQRALHV